MGIWAQVKNLDAWQPQPIDMQNNQQPFGQFHHLVRDQTGAPLDVSGCDAVLLRVRSSKIVTIDADVSSIQTKNRHLWPRDDGQAKVKPYLATMILSAFTVPKPGAPFPVNALFGNGISRRAVMGTSPFLPVFEEGLPFPVDSDVKKLDATFLAQIYAATPGELRTEIDPLFNPPRTVVCGYPPLGELHYTITLFEDNNKQGLPFVGTFSHEVWLWTAT